MKDLTVEIPKKYKKALTERFSLKNAKKKKRDRLWENEIFVINKKCPLCNDYRHVGGCGKCPFVKFKTVDRPGCLVWIDQLISKEYVTGVQPYTTRVIWFVDDDKQARKELKLLKKKARKLIKWV